jgi:hypothetical protein
LLTTFTEKVRAAYKREPLAFIFAAFFFLTGAGTGMTARQILTAAPSVSGAVNLASTTGSEGTGTALMRADATLGVQGILPIANGGTGVAGGAVNLQAATPGSAQTGNSNITGAAIADVNRSRIYWNPSLTGYVGLWDETNKIWQGFNPGAPPGGSPIWQWTTGTPLPGFSNDNGHVYQWSVNGVPAMGINRQSRVMLGQSGPLGGIAGLGNSGLVVNVPGNSAEPSLTVDTGGVACAPGNKKLFVVNGNAVEKFSIQCDGVVNTAAGGFAIKVGSVAVALTPGAVAANSCLVSATQTVAGAAFGDSCEWGVSTDWEGTNSLVMTCGVAAAGLIRFKWCNPTVAGITPTAGTYTARVMR